MKKQKSLAELSSRQLHALHKKLWGWLAETGSEDKYAWPGWEAFEHTHVISGCFACYAKFSSVPSRGCERCPVNPPGGSPHECLGGLWAKWDRAKRSDTRKRLAAQIRDLPWDHSKVRKAKKCSS